MGVVQYYNPSKSDFVGIYSNMTSTLHIFLFLFLMCDVYVADEVKSVLVMEGDSVTLNPDLNLTQGFKMIQWCFGDISPVIAEIYANETSYPNDKIFRDRLQLNQTGSLSIKNTRTTDSGLYKLEVHHNSGASYMTFSVTVYALGLSPGAKAGIVVVVLLVFAAAAIDMMCYRCFFSDLKKLKRLSVMEGETVTLKPDIKVKRDDEILWKFGPQGICIAEIREGAREIFDFGDGEFKGRLTLDQTGSLTITNTRTTDSGVYELQMKRSSGVSDEIFCVNVCGYVEEETKFVMEGRYITLSRFNKEIQKNELIVWMFGDQETLIAQMTGGSRKTFDGPDGRFRGRLKLDKRTGDLTIRRMKCEHTGHYKLQISCSSKGTYYKTFKVVTNGMFGPKTVSVMEGEYLGLYSETYIQRGEQVQWSFEGKTLATGMNGDFKKTSYGDDERFKDRLELHHPTGDLIFRNATTSDTGVYQLQISSIKKRNIHREYTLTVQGNRVNESETAEIPLLSKEDVDGVNEQQMMSSV